MSATLIAPSSLTDRVGELAWAELADNLER